MQQKKRSPGFILAILCTFTLLLAACQASTSSEHHTSRQNTTRLNLRETPGTSGTMTPGTNKSSEYVAHVSAENAWVGLSSTGKRMVAFVTDGSQGHQPTFAQWFRGPVTNDVVDATARGKNGNDRLQATLNGDTATGTVTLAGGKSIPFTANAVTPSEPMAGFYRSEREVNNQRYVAGWIVLPAGAAGTATPQATGTVTPGATTTGTPSATETVTPSATETGTPSATATTTPSGTATGTPSGAGALQQGGAILNEQNFNVLPTLPLTQDQIKSKEVTIPNLTTFRLTPCGKNLC